MRSKGSLVLLSLALLLVLPHLAIGAGPGVHFFDCKECHLTGTSANTLGNDNVCTQCHNQSPVPIALNPGAPQGTPTAIPSIGFVTGDASNQYGNNLAPGAETSHNWAATSTNPAAGAAEPNRTLHPSFYSRYGTTTGKVACSRCHNPHGEYATNPTLMQTKADRVTPMTPDEMCLACHKTFGDSVPANHGLLSHPLVTDYATFQSNNSADYKLVTDDSATAPDSYANGIQLVNGNVSCLSCHNLHFTDSNSSTADGPGAATNGDGLMLRGDGPQFVNDPAKATTFCTTCHNSDPVTSMHGSATVDMGCMGCHGGHNYNNNNPSYFMLNENYTELPTEFGGTAKREDLWGGTQVGVVDGFCESCHGDMADPPFNATRVHTQGENCSTCHRSHAEGAFSKPVGCDGCHGSPPQFNAPGNVAAAGYVLNGYAWAPNGSNSAVQYDYLNDSGHFKDETTTPHVSHAGTTSRYGFSCQVCHNTHITDFAGTHNKDNTSFRDVLEAGYTYDSKSVASGAANPVYNDAAANCNNVYCHSNGGVNDGAGTRTFNFTTPGWNATKDTIVGQSNECSSCHGNDSATMTSSNNSVTHQAHLGQGFSCNICHVDTASGSTALQTGAINVKHMNQLIDVVFDETSPLKAGGANVAHGANPWGGPGNVTCSAVYCHSTGQDAVPGDRVYKSITWTSSGPLTCNSCHNITAGTNQTAAHAAHVNGSTSNVGRNLDCAVCHDDTMNAGNNTTIAAVAFHVNGQVDVAMPVTIDPAQDCSTSLCHSDGNLGSVTDHVATANPKNNTPAWTLADSTPGTFNACDKCHGDDATNKAYPAYADGGAGSTDANSHNKHVGSSNIPCQDCHVTTTLDSTSVVLGGTHVDQKIDVSSSKINSWDGTTCSATVCHGAGTPQWGGTVACGSCHAANNTLAQSHPAHYNAVAVGDYANETNSSTTGNYIIQCGVCHSTNGTVGITHAGGWVRSTVPRLTAEVNFDGTVADTSATYTSGSGETADNGFYYSDATCASLYCHGNFGGNGNAASPTWGSAASGACGSCHDADNSVAMDGGAHDVHVKNIGINCDVCHGATAVNSTGGIADKSLHVNQSLNWHLDASKAQLTTSSTYRGSNAGTRVKADVGSLPYGNCDNIYCHSDVQASPPSGYNGVTFATPNWGGAVNCGDCHNAGPAGGVTEQTSGSHSDHVSASKYAIGCTQCHQGAGTGTAKHADFAVDVSINGSWGGNYNGTPVPGDAYSNCSTVYCHSNGQTGGGRVDSTPTWGTTINDCVSCHEGATAATNLSGAHEEHTVTASAGTTIGKTLGCVDCHTTTVSDNTTIADYTLHVNGGVDVTSCATNVCHSNGNFGADLVQYNPNFATDTLDCFNCHGDNTSKSHPVYASNGAAATSANTHVEHVETSLISCEECHADTSKTGTSIDGLTPALHVDGAIDVVFKQTGSFDGATDTCSTTYCHGSGTPQWGGPALNCDSCHSASSALANSHGVHYNSATVATAINANNNSTAGRYIFQCGNCHNATTHAGGAVSTVQAAEVNLAGSGSYSANVTAAAASPDRGFAFTDGTCGTNDCHNDGTAAKGAPNTTAPQWTSSLAATCTGCHNNNVASGSAMVSGAHTKHINNANNGASKACQSCHNATVDATDRAISNKSVHVNTLLNVAILGSLDGGNSAYAGSCDAVYCHSTGQSTSNGNSATPTYNTVTWAIPASAACGTCHKVTEATGLTSGSHAAHLGTSGVNGCADCHTGALNDASAYNSSNHVNKLIDVANTYTLGGVPGNGYGTCSTASCHDDGTGTLAVTPQWGTTGGCASCHLSNMVSGSHNNHLGSAINNTAISCGNCHDSAVKDTTAPIEHLDTWVNVYNSATGDFGGSYLTGKAKGTAYGSCATTYCHGDSLKFSTIDQTAGLYNVAVNPTWGSNLSNGTCDYCHGFPPVGDIGSGAQHPTSTSCDSCHFHVNATNNGFVDVTKHIDRIVQVDGGDACIDCHGAGKYKDPNLNHPDHADHTDVYAFIAGKSLTTGDYGDPAKGWFDVTYDATGRLVAGCGQCHSDDQATFHLSGVVDMQLDPNSATQLIPTPNAKRGNTGESYSQVTGQCSAVYCHSDGNGTYDATPPTWGGIAENLTCADCHGNSPTTAAHGVHEVGIHYAELYDPATPGLLTASGTVGSGAAHGDTDVSTTINCFTCHNGTVTNSANSANSTCVTCHNSRTGNALIGDELASIQVSSTVHLNGAKDVTFADLSLYKSKAQLRDNLSDADDGISILSAIWNRITGYKGATDYDQPKAAFATPTYTSGTATCSTVACHNNNDATWAAPTNDCMACHTSLPK